MTDDEFDRALDEFAAALITTLRDKDYQDLPTTARLVYPDRVIVKSLVEDGDFFEFGRALALQGNPPPGAVLVAQSNEDLRVHISGCTRDRRRNAIRLTLERTRWRKILRPMQIERRYYRDGVQVDGPNPAGEVLRGWSVNP